MDCIVHGVTKSWTWRSDIHSHLYKLGHRTTTAQRGLPGCSVLESVVIKLGCCSQSSHPGLSVSRAHHFQEYYLHILEVQLLVSSE